MSISDWTTEKLLDQEVQLQFTSFGLDDGLRLGGMLLAQGQADKSPLVINVFAFGQTVFHAALPGCSNDNAVWVQRKRNTVLRFAHSSLYMGALCREKDTTLGEKFHVPDVEFAAHGGSFPIVLMSGGLIGAVTVSGLSQVEDHVLVVSALEKMIIAATNLTSSMR